MRIWIISTMALIIMASPVLAQEAGYNEVSIIGKSLLKFLNTVHFGNYNLTEIGYICLSGECRNSWPASGGTVSSITAGDGLAASPNPITTTGTILLDWDRLYAFVYNKTQVEDNLTKFSTLAYLNTNFYNKTQADDMNSSNNNYAVYVNGTMKDYVDTRGYAASSDLNYYATLLYLNGNFYNKTQSDTTLGSYSTLSYLNTNFYNKTESNSVNDSNNNHIAEVNASNNNKDQSNNDSITNFINSNNLSVRHNIDTKVNKSGDIMTGNLSIYGGNLSMLNGNLNITGGYLWVNGSNYTNATAQIRAVGKPYNSAEVSDQGISLDQERTPYYETMNIDDTLTVKHRFDGSGNKFRWTSVSGTFYLDSGSGWESQLTLPLFNVDNVFRIYRQCSGGCSWSLDASTMGADFGFTTVSDLRIGGEARLETNLLSTERTFEFPDSDGTIALLSNLNSYSTLSYLTTAHYNKTEADAMNSSNNNYIIDANTSQNNRMDRMNESNNNYITYTNATMADYVNTENIRYNDTMHAYTNRFLNKSGDIMTGNLTLASEASFNVTGNSSIGNNATLDKVSIYGTIQNTPSIQKMICRVSVNAGTTDNEVCTWPVVWENSSYVVIGSMLEGQDVELNDLEIEGVRLKNTTNLVVRVSNNGLGTRGADVHIIAMRE